MTTVDPTRAAQAKRSKPKTPKPKTPKPHPMAFVGEAPCTICGCEWFRPTIRFTDDNGVALEKAAEGAACANLWCVMIAQLRNVITKQRAELLLLAKLAAKESMFNNPIIAWEAEALRDRILSKVNTDV